VKACPDAVKIAVAVGAVGAEITHFVVGRLALFGVMLTVSAQGAGAMT
jgi:hypothetical protein